MLVLGYMSVHLRTIVRIIESRLTIHFLVQAFCQAMVDKFSSIDMKSTTTKSVLELKGELKLICCNIDTWDLWTQFFDAHSSGDLINPETGEKYVDKNLEAPPVVREFFRCLQGLTESELQRCALHLLGRTPGRNLAYPKIFLKKPKNKAGTYSIRQWTDHRKHKTIAMRELDPLVPGFNFFNADGEINWAEWRAFKAAYHINGLSMRTLVKEHASTIISKTNKRTKKSELTDAEVNRYKMFLERKKAARFEGVARFCVVTSAVERVTFSKWNRTMSRSEVREDRRGCPFAIIDFRTLPGVNKTKPAGVAFYNPFMAKFQEFKSPAMREPRVWLWIVDAERLPAVVELYEATIKYEYNIYHSTYVPAKTEGIMAFPEARGVKQVGAICLLFLTLTEERDGRAPIKASTIFKKIYKGPASPPKELLQETLFSVFPAQELRMEFYVTLLRDLCAEGETVYNVAGGTKFMYAAMVSPHHTYERSFVNGCSGQLLYEACYVD